MKLAGFDALAISGISGEDVVVIVDGDAKTISITGAPVYGEDIDTGALFYGERLLQDANNGNFSDNLAAVVAGQGALNARFGIINSLFFDRRRNRIRSKQAGRGGTGTVMRAKNLHGIVVKSSLPKANGNNPINKEMTRQAGAKLKEVISKCDSAQLNLGAWGTTGLSEYMDKFHLFPINNYQIGQSPDSSQTFWQSFPG